MRKSRAVRLIRLADSAVCFYKIPFIGISVASFASSLYSVSVCIARLGSSIILAHSTAAFPFGQMAHSNAVIRILVLMSLVSQYKKVIRRANTWPSWPPRNSNETAKTYGSNRKTWWRIQTTAAPLTSWICNFGEIEIHVATNKPEQRQGGISRSVNFRLDRAPPAHVYIHTVGERE